MSWLSYQQKKLLDGECHGHETRNVAPWHLDLLIVEPDKGLIGECNTIVTGIQPYLTSCLQVADTSYLVLFPIFVGHIYLFRLVLPYLIWKRMQSGNETSTILRCFGIVSYMAVGQSQNPVPQ